MRIEVIDNREKLSGIEDLWTSFTRENFPHLCNDYFWNRAALNSYFPRSPVKVFLFYDRKELVGILPLCLNKSTFAKLPVWKYHFFEQGIGLSTLLLQPSRLTEYFKILWADVAKYLPEFQVLKLTTSGKQKEELFPFFKMIQHNGYHVLFTNKKVLRLKIKSGKEFREHVFTGHHRREFRRIERRLRENFNCQIEQPKCDNLTGDFAVYWQRFIHLYQKSWKHSSARSLSNRASENTFFQTIFRHFAQIGRLYVSFLRLDGTDVASDWRVLHQGVVYGLQTVFDEKYRRYAPGLYLLQTGLLNLTKEGNLEFDYLGNQQFKKYISNTHHTYHDIYILTSSIYGRILKHFSTFSKARFRFLK